MFMIVGGVILLVAILSVAVMNLNKNKTPDYPEDTKEIYLFTNDCIDYAVDSTVKGIAVQGGALRLSENSMIVNEFATNYGVWKNKKILSSKEDMENDISRVVSSSVLDCVENFSMFKGKNISFEIPKVETAILPEKVLVNIRFPIEIKTKSDVKKIDDFSIVSNLRLGKLYSYVDLIIDEQLKNPDYMDMSYLTKFDAKVIMMPKGNGSFLLTVEDEEISFVVGENFVFNSPPTINVRDVFTVSVGKNLSFTVECFDPNGDEVIVSDDTAMLETLKSGQVTGEMNIPGNHIVNFECIDSKGAKAEQSIEIRVD